MLVSHVSRDATLTRLRFKRQKIVRSPERSVPCDKRYVNDIDDLVQRHGLKRSDELFGMVDRALFERAHTRAAKASEQPGLRIKDFRHLAAISWRKSGATIERVSEWLGHSNISQTAVYTASRADDKADGVVVGRAADAYREIAVAPDTEAP